MSRGRVEYINQTNFVPNPEKVLIISPPRDVYENDPLSNREACLTDEGLIDGFAEYNTNIPKEWRFSTAQKDYGFAFLEANVVGPTYLHYSYDKTITEHLESGKYEVLAISALTWTLPWALDLARKAKSKYGFKEVWLGSYAVMTDEPQIKEVFDRLFWGYSEDELNKAIGKGPILKDDIRHPDLTTRASWLGRTTKVGHLLFRRGCSNKCTYCADPAFVPGGDHPLSIEAIERILDYYIENGIRSVYISNQDTNLFDSVGSKVLKAITQRGLSFGMLTSFHSLAFCGEDGIKELRDRGLTFLLIGLETLNDTNIEKTKRRANHDFMVRTLSLLRKLNVSVTTTYMICFEDDTEESIREAKKKIIDLGVTVSLFNITMPLPGTPMYWSYKQQGIITDWNWTHWTGNYLVWKHPCISPEKAKELLMEIRYEVNVPDTNPTLKCQWERSLKKQSTSSLLIQPEMDMRTHIIL